MVPAQECLQLREVCPDGGCDGGLAVSHQQDVRRNVDLRAEASDVSEEFVVRGSQLTVMHEVRQGNHRTVHEVCLPEQQDRDVEVPQVESSVIGQLLRRFVSPQC